MTHYRPLMVDSQGRDVRANLLMQRHWDTLAELYEDDMSTLPHAAYTAVQYRQDARDAKDRARTILRIRYHGLRKNDLCNRDILC